MYRRYYTPFDENPVVKNTEPEVIRPERLEPAERRCRDDCPDDRPCDCRDDCPGDRHRKDGGIFGGFFDNISTEDVVLIGILILLLAEEPENRDIPLLLAIGFILLMGLIDRD